LILSSYKLSLSVLLSGFLTSNTPPKPPRFKPAGANHSAATLSLNAYTPGNTTDGGTQVGLPALSSNIFTQG